MTFDQFFRNLWPKQIFRRADRQTSKCQMATILTTGPLGRQNLSSKTKIMKIGALAQKLRLNIHLEKISSNCVTFPSLKSVENENLITSTIINTPFQFCVISVS